MSMMFVLRRLVLLLAALMLWVAPASAHDIPSDATVQAFVKPEGHILRLLVRLPLKTVDEPESPMFSPDGKKNAVSAMRAGISDIYTIDLATSEVVNLTADDFYDYGPTYSPDGTYIVENVRISGNQKLFRLDLATKKRTQLTFAPQDETAAQFLDDHTLIFASTGTDPAKPLDPEVAKNGNIYNIWTLDMTSGELKQYTDALGGTFSPVLLNEGTTKRMAFVTYYKGDWGIHALDRKDPLHTAASGPLMPCDGSPITVSVLCRRSALACKPAWVSLVERTRASRKASRARLIPDTSTPVPSQPDGLW